jgi:hypothetical protein
MQPELEQIVRRQVTADNDGNVVKFHERKGKERNAGDPNFIGWLSDRLAVPHLSTPKAKGAASRSAIAADPNNSGVGSVKETRSTPCADTRALSTLPLSSY